MLNFEQRKAPRVRFTAKTCLTWREGRVHGYSLDISGAGMFVETTTLLPLGTAVVAKFDLVSTAGADRVVATGRVARTISSSDTDPGGTFLGMGVAFDRIQQGEDALRAGVGAEDMEVAWSLPEPVMRPPTDQRQEPCGAERRGAPRVPVGIPVWWGLEDPPANQGHVGNISTTGALVLHAGEPLPDGTRVFLRLNLPVKGRVVEIRGMARVVRVSTAQDRETNAVGLHFEAGTMDTVNLSRFIALRLKRANELADLEQARDNRLRVPMGHTSKGFLARSGAWLLGGVVAIHLAVAVLLALI